VSSEYSQYFENCPKELSDLLGDLPEVEGMDSWLSEYEEKIDGLKILMGSRFTEVNVGDEGLEVYTSKLIDILGEANKKSLEYFTVATNSLNMISEDELANIDKADADVLLVKAALNLVKIARQNRSQYGRSGLFTENGIL